MGKKKLAPCYNHQGRPRRSYRSRTAAEEGVYQAKHRYGNDMVPYTCKQCGNYHLCPPTRLTPSHHCEPCEKLAYDTLEGAFSRADILEEERSVELAVYECAHGEGWHLTSHLDWKAEQERLRAENPEALEDDGDPFTRLMPLIPRPGRPT